VCASGGERGQSANQPNGEYLLVGLDQGGRKNRKNIWKKEMFPSLACWGIMLNLYSKGVSENLPQTGAA